MGLGILDSFAVGDGFSVLTTRARILLRSFLANPDWALLPDSESIWHWIDEKPYRIIVAGCREDALDDRFFDGDSDRKVQSATFPINSSTAWLNKHHLDYWAEFERQYVKSQAPAAAVEIPQKLKDALAAGKARLERYFSGGEFRTGVLSLDGKGWFNSIADWLASC